MKLVKLESDQFEVLAVVNDGNACPLLVFLHAQSQKKGQMAKGFKFIFRRYASHGMQGLPPKTSHEASKRDKIYEFIKGRLRVYYFADERGLIILSHGIVKKKQKSSQHDIATVIKLRNNYLKEKNENTLETLDIKGLKESEY